MGRTTNKNQPAQKPLAPNLPTVDTPDPDLDEGLKGLGLPGLSDDDGVEDFDDIFGPEDDGSAEYRILRKQPAFDSEGNRIVGYCGLLPFGQNIEWIRQNLGGGVFRVQRYERINGKQTMTEARTVTIAGPPKVPASPVSTPSAAAVVPVTRSEVIPERADRSVRGMTLEDVKELMITKHLLEENKAPDVNSVLLETILAMLKQQRNPIQELIQTVAVIDKLRGSDHAGSDNGGGTGLMDLIGKGVDVLGKYIDKAQSPPPEAANGAPEASQTIPAAGQITAARKEPEEVNPMNVANAAVATIVNAFLEEPQYEVSRTVGVIRQFVPDAARPVIQANQAALKDMAVLALHESTDPDPDVDRKFLLYFDQVFAMFLSQTEPEAQKGRTNEQPTP
jgi:hypothetical protein